MQCSTYRAQLALAGRKWAVKGLPVRLRLHFSGRRQVTLRLDPGNVPATWPTLVPVARQGLLQRPPRCPAWCPTSWCRWSSDTTDGGPGYTGAARTASPGRSRQRGHGTLGQGDGRSQFHHPQRCPPISRCYTRVGEVTDWHRARPLLDQLELGAILEKAEVLPSGEAEDQGETERAPYGLARSSAAGWKRQRRAARSASAARPGWGCRHLHPATRPASSTVSSSSTAP